MWLSCGSWPIGRCAIRHKSEHIDLHLVSNQVAEKSDEDDPARFVGLGTCSKAIRNNKLLRKENILGRRCFASQKHLLQKAALNNDEMT